MPTTLTMYNYIIIANRLRQCADKHNNTDDAHNKQNVKCDYRGGGLAGDHIQPLSWVISRDGWHTGSITNEKLELTEEH